MREVAIALWYASVHSALQATQSGFPRPSSAMVDYINARYSVPDWVSRKG